jgi:hypothetical protein
MGWLQQFFSGPFGIILPIITVVCLLHALSRRAEYYWFFIILFVPYIGALFYFFVNVLPDFRRANVGAAFNTFKPTSMRVRDLERQLEDVDTAQTRIALAVAYRDSGQSEKAEAMLEQTRQGVYRNDSHLMFDLATIKFALNKFEEAESLLQELLPSAPEELRGVSRVLLGRILEQRQVYPEAEALYRAALGVRGEEPRFRLANVLLAQGKTDQGNTVLRELERNAKRATPQYRAQEREWFEAARKLQKQ